MKFIFDYWYIIVAFLALGAVAGIAIYCFFKKPAAEQIEKVREWLLWAVTEAEKALGGGTGQLKLRYVYDMFVGKFPQVAMVISFDFFSEMVDEALEDMRHLLETNDDVAAYVEIGSVSPVQIISDGIAVEDLTDEQLRSLLDQMGYTCTEDMTREEMLAELDALTESE